MSNGYFSEEEIDIVRLNSPHDNDGHDRKGWVNVGAFAVSIETNGDGDILVELYPCSNEDPKLCMGSISAKRIESLDKGGKDCDDEDEA